MLLAEPARRRSHVTGGRHPAVSTRQVPPLVPPVCRTGALLVSYASMGTPISGHDGEWDRPESN